MTPAERALRAAIRWLERERRESEKTRSGSDGVTRVGMGYRVGALTDVINELRRRRAREAIRSRSRGD